MSHLSLPHAFFLIQVIEELYALLGDQVTVVD